MLVLAPLVSTLLVWMFWRDNAVSAEERGFCKDFVGIQHCCSALTVSVGHCCASNGRRIKSGSCWWNPACPTHVSCSSYPRSKKFGCSPEGLLLNQTRPSPDPVAEHWCLFCWDWWCLGEFCLWGVQYLLPLGAGLHAQKVWLLVCCSAAYCRHQRSLPRKRNLFSFVSLFGSSLSARLAN